jgi:two-component system chemotaxis sensor kinase CheA
MFSGNTILGDGSVIMILDPNGIAAASGATAVEQGRGREVAAPVARGSERSSLLLFRAGTNGPKAVPLALVARLEEVDLATVERSNGKPVVQYRGKIMPLVTIDPAYEIGSEGRKPVLVFADRDYTMGLVVDEILDIVEEHLAIELVADRPGYIGSSIIASKATDCIDVGYFLTLAFAKWFAQDESDFGGTEPSKRILVVDDSPFFRNLLAPLLTVAGYDVTTVDSADRAFGLCEQGVDFDVIISDIEMPGMNGFQFAKTVRDGSTRWQKTPIVALSSHTTPSDLDRGREVGFSDYVAKFDREALLTSLSETLSLQKSAA